jgi:acyl carrier protein
MNLDDFIKNMAAQFEDADTANFNAGTEYKALDEWSSMMVLSIIAMVDNEYNVQIKGTTIRDADTIEDLFNAVKELVH